MSLSEPVSIIIPAFNQLAYCRQCIDTLRMNTDTGSYRLILVDNGSDDGVGEYFDSLEGAVVIHAGENRGFAGGVNLGLAEARGHVLLLNSDTLVSRGWLPRLRDALEREDRVGIVGPMSNYVSGPQLIPDLEFTAQDEIDAYGDRLFAKHCGSYVVTNRLVGFCMLIRDTAFSSVGLFDERFGIGNYEDDDYGLRVQQAGYELRIASDCFVFHFGSRTFAGMGIQDDQWTNLLTENESRFREKWNAEPEHDRSAARASSISLNREARSALERGDHASAMSLLTKAIRTSPEIAENYNDLGAVLWGIGESERAIRLFNRALALDSGYSEALENLAAAEAAVGGDTKTFRKTLLQPSERSNT